MKQIVEQGESSSNEKKQGNSVCVWDCEIKRSTASDRSS